MSTAARETAATLEFHRPLQALNPPRPLRLSLETADLLEDDIQVPVRAVGEGQAVPHDLADDVMDGPSGLRGLRLPLDRRHHPTTDMPRPRHEPQRLVGPGRLRPVPDADDPMRVVPDPGALPRAV